MPKRTRNVTIRPHTAVSRTGRRGKRREHGGFGWTDGFRFFARAVAHPHPPPGRAAARQRRLAAARGHDRQPANPGRDRQRRNRRDGQAGRHADPRRLATDFWPRYRSSEHPLGGRSPLRTLPADDRPLRGRGQTVRGRRQRRRHPRPRAVGLGHDPPRPRRAGSKPSPSTAAPREKQTGSRISGGSPDEPDRLLSHCAR